MFLALDTHCYKPVAPSETGMQAYNWNDLMIPVDEEHPFHCKHGMKWKTNLTATTINSTCKGNFSWSEPAKGWPQCVASKLSMCNLIIQGRIEIGRTKSFLDASINERCY